MKKFIYVLLILSFGARGQDQVLNKSGKLMHVMVPGDSGRFVRLTGDQRIEGVKNFADSVSFNNSLTVGNMWIQSNSGSIAIGQRWIKISKEFNIALGNNALGNNNNGDRNIAIGPSALEGNHNGNDNIVIGYEAMKDSWNESNNLAIGKYALHNTGGGEYNVAVGNNTLTNPSWYSTAVGFSALKSSSFGISNTAVGSFALTSNTEGSSNTAMGDSALAKNTTGGGNIALGYQALKSNATGSNNIAIGKHTLTGSNDVGFYNIAIGDAVMQNALNTQNNVVIGHFAGQSIKAANSLGGSGNTGIGGWNFRELRFGSNNVALGYYAGDSLSTGSNNIAIGAYQKLPGSANDQNNPNHSNRMNIGGLLFGKNMTGNFGNPAGQLGIGVTEPTERLEVKDNIKASGSVIATSHTTSSDSRLKTNVENILNALTIVGQLHPVKYDKKSDLSASTYDYHEFGFLAQEMKAILPLLVSEGKDPNKLLSLNYTALIPILTKAIQEQQAIIIEQKKNMEELIKRVEKLEKK